jgi:hypothetical protein
VAILVALSELSAVSFIWITPPRTAYMLQDGGDIGYQYVSIDHIRRRRTLWHPQLFGPKVAVFWVPQALSAFT